MTEEGPVERVMAGHLQVARDLNGLTARIDKIADETVAILDAGRRILICGNGGSAVQSQHFSGELVGRFEEERGGLPAISLTADIASLTAITNDFGYDQVFVRQVEALGAQGDMLYGLSTSGESSNVVKAVERAGQFGMTTVALTGGGGGRLAAVADYSIVVPSHNTARIQEAHLIVIHAVCAKVDAAFSGMDHPRARES